MAVMGDFAWAAQVVHEAAVSECVDGYLRSFIRDRQYKLAGTLHSRLIAIAPDHIEITTASCIYVMDHYCLPFVI